VPANLRADPCALYARSMEYRHLGKSGMKISAIAYGNWLTHGAQVDKEAATKCVHAALDAGITTFDTADVYASGQAESILGEALQGVRRESVEIFTKVYWPTGPGQNDRGLSAKHIMESCNASLKRLKTDYVDLYQAHRYDYETPLEETLAAFDNLVRQGKVLYVGVSEWRAEEIADAVRIAKEEHFRPIVSNQPEYSLLRRVIEGAVVPLCQREGIGQIVWSPLAQGVLTGKYKPGQPPPPDSRASDPGGSNFISRYLKPEVLSRVEEAARLASEAGMPLAQLALAWVLGRPGISAAIAGATKPEQVAQNAAAADIKLDKDLAKAVEAVLDPVAVKNPLLTRSPWPRA